MAIMRDCLNIGARNDLYNYVVTDETTAVVGGISAYDDAIIEFWHYDVNSSATDNGTTVIKPTSVMGNGRWLILDKTQAQADWTEGSSSAKTYITNKPSLASVATSGSYTDLSNTPTNGVPTGAVIPYVGSTAPSQWLLCDGSAVSRTGSTAALFAIIGTSYGMGDGSTTFNLPDTRQRFPLGLSTSGTGSTLGATGGAIDHTHGSPLTTGAPSAVIGNLELGLVQGPTDTHTHSVTIPSANPPFQVFNFIIKI